MILLRADGMTITDIARAVGMSRRHVYKWLHRFRQTGLAGLDEKLDGATTGGRCAALRPA